MAHQMDTEALEAMVNRLLMVREREGRLPTEYVELIATTIGCSTRTVRRWVARGTAVRRTREAHTLTDLERELYFDCLGSVRGVMRELDKRGVKAPSRATLQRAYKSQLTQAERAYARTGEHARRKHVVYLERPATHRNAVWEADHKQLGVQVIPPRGVKPVCPWATFLIDDASRAIAGYSVSLMPTAGDVVAAIRMGVAGSSGIGPVCGVPHELRWDNGKEFLSTAATQVALQLHALPRPLPPYQPHLKGKIERFNRTIDQEFLSTLPYFQGGPRNAANKLYGPSSGPLGFALFLELLHEWVLQYNTERKHSALDGRTPAEVYDADPTPLDLRTDDELRWMALPSRRSRVTNQGIKVNKLKYVAPELNQLVGETVEVRHMPHDDRWIDVYTGGRFLCRAKPSNALTEDERERFFAKREQDAKRARNERRKASARARARHAPMTGGTVTDITTVVSREDARREDARRESTSRPRSDAKAGDAPDRAAINKPYTPSPASDGKPDNPETRQEDAQ